MRNIIKVADDIINIIKEKCTFDKDKKEGIIIAINNIKTDACYRAPELAYIDWRNLANILSKNFIPSNSKWETEIMILFNDLDGTVEDYYQDK